MPMEEAGPWVRPAEEHTEQEGPVLQEEGAARRDGRAQEEAVPHREPPWD